MKGQKIEKVVINFILYWQDKEERSDENFDYSSHRLLASEKIGFFLEVPRNLFYPIDLEFKS